MIALAKQCRLPLNNSPTWRLAHRVRSSLPGGWLDGRGARRVGDEAPPTGFSTAVVTGRTEPIDPAAACLQARFRFRKDFIERDLFKRQDRQDLEYRVEWGLDSELLANRRDRTWTETATQSCDLTAFLRCRRKSSGLFDPLKKQLYLPAALVLADGEARRCGRHQSLAAGRVPNGLGGVASSAGRAIESDGLVG